jgi:hypothetical protein
VFALATIDTDSAIAGIWTKRLTAPTSMQIIDGGLRVIFPGWTGILGDVTGTGQR